MVNKDRYAVVGFPIKHSKSPRIHRLFAEQTGQDIEYTAIELPPGQFHESVKCFFAEGGKGLNCTLPLKELAWQFADVATPRAGFSKAVNTLILQADGHILGDNTDGCGFIRDLTVNHNIALAGARVLILGAGGATRGIIAPILEQNPLLLTIANRTADKARQLAAEFESIGAIDSCGLTALADKEFDFIVNATSASLSNELPPLPDGLLAGQGSCYDLAYANEPTAFVRWGQARQAKHSLDGLGMLVEQAAEAFYLWRGVRPATRPVIDLLNTERQEHAR